MTRMDADGEKRKKSQMAPMDTDQEKKVEMRGKSRVGA